MLQPPLLPCLLKFVGTLSAAPLPLLLLLLLPLLLPPEEARLCRSDAPPPPPEEAARLGVPEDLLTMQKHDHMGETHYHMDETHGPMGETHDPMGGTHDHIRGTAQYDMPVTHGKALRRSNCLINSFIDICLDLKT